MAKITKMGRKSEHVMCEYRTSSTYRAARIQQRTACRKEWYVEGEVVENYTSPVEAYEAGNWIGWRNASVKGRISRVVPRAHFTKNGYKRTFVLLLVKQ